MAESAAFDRQQAEFVGGTLNETLEAVNPKKIAINVCLSSLPGAAQLRQVDRRGYGVSPTAFTLEKEGY